MTSETKTGVSLVTDDATDDVLAELARLRERRAELAARRQARADAKSPNEKVAEEERALADDEAIERFETEIGPDEEKIRVVRTKLGVVIVKRAHPAAYKQFMDLKSTKVEDCEKLARKYVVYPAAARLDEITEQLPATWLRLAGALTRLAGHSNAELEEK